MTTTPAPGAPEDMNELYDAQIDRVDMVGAAANGHRFLIAKNAAGLVTPNTIRDLLKDTAPAETTTPTETPIAKESTDMADQNTEPAAVDTEAVTKETEAPAETVEKTEAPAETVAKADSMLLVCDRSGTPIGVIDPSALIPVDGGDAPDAYDDTADDTDKAAVNPTEADGSSAVDGADYGSDTDDARVIPGTNTVQAPVAKTGKPKAKKVKKTKKAATTDVTTTAGIATMLKEALEPLAEKLNANAELASTIEVLKERIEKFGAQPDNRTLPAFNGANGTDAGIAPREGSGDVLEPLRKAVKAAEESGDPEAMKKANAALLHASVLNRFTN